MKITPFVDHKNVSWIYFADPSQEIIAEILRTYDVHEIIEDDVSSGELIQDKVDVYDDAIFLVLHFPKYFPRSKKYFSNEFSMILTKKAIISLVNYETNHMAKLRDDFLDEIKNAEDKEQEKFKSSPSYVLYQIVDVMYDKMLNVLRKFGRDLTQIEEDIFSGKVSQHQLLEDLLIKKRNIVFLKNMIYPQLEILEELHKAVMKFYNADLDVYFEDLEYKIDKILRNISLLTDNTNTLIQIHDSLGNVRTNSIVSMLTVFTVIIGILTMITGLYGMNIGLPFQSSPSFFFVVLGCMLVIGIGMLGFFKWKKWI